MQVEGHKNDPLSAGRWADFLQKSSLSLAFLLLASAGICWIAANWAQASVFQKLAGAQTLLVALVLMTWRLVYVSGANKGQKFSLSANMAGLAAVTTGGLLALVGQIYQTGADPWELFLLWAVLLIPWLVVMRTVFLAVLFAVLLNVAAALYLGIYEARLWLGLSSWVGASLLVALMNAALLVLWEYGIAWLDDRWRVGPRMLGTGALAWLIAATLAALDSHMGAFAIAVPGLLATGLMYWVYTSKRSDLAMVCLAALAAFCLVMISLISWLDSEEALLLVIVALIVLAGLALRHLRALVRARNAASGSDQSVASVFQEPWFLSLFRLAVMGITAGLLILFLFLVLNLRTGQLLPLGLVMCAGGVWAFRASSSDIPRELGMTLMAAGLLLTGAGLFVMDDVLLEIRVAALLLAGALLYVLVANTALRFLSAFFVLALVLALTWRDLSAYALFDAVESGLHRDSFFAYSRLWWLGAGAVLVLTVASRSRDATFWTPLAWALVCLAQMTAWLTPAPALYGFASLWQEAPILALFWLACAVLPVLVLAAMLWRVRDLPAIVRVGAPVALAVASLGWMGAPGIAMALVWLVLGYAFGRRTLLVFGVLALLAYLSRFYYLMDSTLLQKSWVLCLTGAWLLLSWCVLRKLVRKSGSRDTDVAGHIDRKAGSRQVWREAGLLGGLALILLVVNTGIYQREQILATGQRVVLALAPVDPRSLMQGDYMALRFAAANEIKTMLAQAPAALAQEIEDQQGGYLLLTPDERGVYQLSSLAAKVGTQPNAPSTVPLEFRLRGNTVRIVTDAWFFPEGEASRFEQARYGNFRVDSKGRGLLTQMLDEQLKPLP